MKYNLLELTQVILSSMDSDEVNSINDTTEATQVAYVVRTAFYDLIERLGLREHEDVFQLVASGDSLKPTIMTRPTDVNAIYWVKYDKRSIDQTSPKYADISYMDPVEFLRRIHGLDTNETTVGTQTHTFGADVITLPFLKDRAPTYWTSWDDQTLVFDSYDSSVDSTLQKSKTICAGLKTAPFSLVDTFVPDLDDQQFAMLLNEAKALAWAELKQTAHVKAEKNSRAHQINALKRKTAVPGNTPFRSTTPYYGRK